MSNIVQVVYKSALSTGTQLAAGTASTASLLPNDSNGTTARACLFVAENNTGAHLKLGLDTSSTVATGGDIFIGTTPVALFTRGSAAFAVIRAVSTQAVNVSAVPIEDV